MIKLNRYTCIFIAVFFAVGGRFCQSQDIKFTFFRATNEQTDSTYKVAGPITLNYKQTHIIIGFLDKNDSVKAIYMYRLVGFDTRWHNNGELTSVNYINLLGGDYELQVRNLNHPNKVIAIKFHIEEAFWQKPWFVPMIIAYGLLVAGMILYFIRIYRLRNQLRLQQIRNEIAADLHDDVGTALSSIAFLGEMAKARFEKKPEDIRQILERIMNESRHMMQTMRGVVWVINPQNDNVADFFDKVKSFSEAVLTSKKIQLAFLTYNIDTQQMGLEVQRNLFLIFKEAVVNAAKHSGASQVTIAIKREKDYLWIRIEDNGIGFEHDLATDGNGLRNLKNRATQLSGNLEVLSESGKGTQIKMVIPIA